MFDRRPRPTAGAGKMVMDGANYKATRSEMCDLIEQGSGWAASKPLRCAHHRETRRSVKANLLLRDRETARRLARKSAKYQLSGAARHLSS
jgi:hypothetical protein